MNWAKEEDDKLAELMKQGLTRREMSEQLPGRTEHAVKCRIAYKSTPWAELAERNKRAKLLRPKKQRATARHHVVSESVNIFVPYHLIEDRERRAATPRSITAILMGDPPFPAERRA